VQVGAFPLNQIPQNVVQLQSHSRHLLLSPFFLATFHFVH
jgi:hypothetical protein